MVTKQSSIEEKQQYLRDCIHNPDATDEVAILNLLNLLSSESLSDALLAQDNILFNDYTEFMDIKKSLKSDLMFLNNELAHNYFSVLTSCKTVKGVRKEQIKVVPPLYKILLLNLGFFKLNGILSNHIKTIDLDNVFIIDDALSIMTHISQPLFVLQNAVQSLITEDDIVREKEKRAKRDHTEVN